jgi:hypothetical protein
LRNPVLKGDQIKATFGNKPIRIGSSREALKDALDRVRDESLM